MTTDEDLRTEEILRVLDGTEINSVHWAGTVMVKDGQLIQGGLIIESLPTLLEARILLNEIMHQEFGTDEELAAILDQEFGDASS